MLSLYSAIRLVREFARVFVIGELYGPLVSRSCRTIHSTTWSPINYLTIANSFSSIISSVSAITIHKLNVHPLTISRPSDKWCSLTALVSWEVHFTPPGLSKILSPLSHYPGHTRNIHLSSKCALFPVSERAWETERVFVCSIRLLSRNHYHQANWLPVSFLAHLNIWWSFEYPFRMLSSRSDKVREQAKGREPDGIYA